MTPRHRLLEVLRLSGLLVLAVALEAVFTSRISILGVTADVFLIFPVLVGMTRGPLVGGVFGFVCGLVADIIFMDPLGLLALICVLTGYLSGRYAEWMPPHSAWAVVALVGVATFCGQFAYGLFLFITGNRAPFLSMVWRQVVPAAVVNALVAAPLHVILVKLRLLPQLSTGGAARS